MKFTWLSNSVINAVPGRSKKINAVFYPVGNIISELYGTLYRDWRSRSDMTITEAKKLMPVDKSSARHGVNKANGTALDGHPRSNISPFLPSF